MYRQDAIRGNSEALSTVTRILDGSGSLVAAIGTVAVSYLQVTLLFSSWPSRQTWMGVAVWVQRLALWLCRIYRYDSWLFTVEESETVRVLKSGRHQGQQRGIVYCHRNSRW